MPAPSSPTPSRRRLSILGSTGSIGTQALDVVRHHAGRFEVVALAARSNVALLLEQVAEFRPAFVHVGDEAAAREVRAALAAAPWGNEPNAPTPRLFTGDEGLVDVAAAAPADMVVLATVGWTGVEPALAAIGAGRDLALANKEVLVCAGELVMREAAARGVSIGPLDSEHNAIAQCLVAGPRPTIRRLILTCSGGPYRRATREEIAVAGPERTLDHPTWDMGRKITVDSATLMNKGFEVIEAHHLFGVPFDQIEVVVHPQSIIHSMVEFVDGSIIAQMGRTDMRLPIQNVLTAPERWPTPVEPLDLARLGALQFEAPDHGRFPCLGMAYEAGRAGGTMPCVLNAANEVAVAAHLAAEIPVGAIASVVRAVLDQHQRVASPSLGELRAADRWARQAATAQIEATARLRA